MYMHVVTIHQEVAETANLQVTAGLPVMNDLMPLFSQASNFNNGKERGLVMFKTTQYIDSNDPNTLVASLQLEIGECAETNKLALTITAQAQILNRKGCYSHPHPHR